MLNEELCQKILEGGRIAPWGPPLLPRDPPCTPVPPQKPPNSPREPHSLFLGLGGGTGGGGAPSSPDARIMKRERVVSSSLLRIWGWHHMEGLLQSLGAWHGPWRCREDTSHPCLWRERGCSNASGGISMGGTLCSRLVPRSRPRSPLFGGRGMAARGAERLFCPQGGSGRRQQKVTAESLIGSNPPRPRRKELHQLLFSLGDSDRAGSSHLPSPPCSFPISKRILASLRRKGKA